MNFDPEAVREFERAGWDRAAPTYEAAFATVTCQFIEPLLDAASIGEGAKILDLCCGPGLLAAAAMARGAVVTGLDFSSAMLAAARARFPTIAFDHGDAEAPPYPDSCFDSVVSNFGIHHVPRPAVALNEAHRILRHGGRFAFSIWSGPEENIAWKLVFDAVHRHGNPRASAAPPPGGDFASADDCLRALDAAGFSGTTATLVRGTWRQPDGAALLAAFRGGTVRMAAMLDNQTEATMPAILSGLEAAASVWRVESHGGGQLAVPVACVIAAGTKR